MFSWCLLAPFAHAQRNVVIDSLERELQQTDSVEYKCRILYDLAWEYLYVDPDKTREYALRGLQIAEKANYPYGEAQAYGTLGLYGDVTGSYDLAIESYLSAIKILEDKPEHAATLASNQHNLSLIFFAIEDWEKAIAYIKRSINYDIEIGDYTGQVYGYLNLALMYKGAGNLDSSLYYHRKCISTGKQNNVTEYQIDYINLAEHFLNEENYDSAIAYLKPYLQFSHNNSSPRKFNRLAHGYNGMARLYINTGNLGLGKLYTDSASTLSKQIKSSVLQISSLANYADYYETKGDFENALRYQKLKEAAQDSTLKIELREKVEVVEARYQKQKQENEINQLKAESEIKELVLAKSETQRWLFLIIAILAILTLTILSIFFYNSRKVQRKLAAKNAIIENLIRESHHRIKNNLQVVSSLLNMQGMTLKSKEAQKAIADAHNRVKTIALLHQRLQGSSDFEYIRLQEFLKELCDNILMGLSREYLEVDLDYKVEDVRVKTDKAIAIGLLINEFLTNSLKYAIRPNTTLRLSLYLLKKGNISITYKDNGPGLEETFVPEESASLGFTIINSLISQLNGKLAIHNSNGFEAYIELQDE